MERKLDLYFEAGTRLVWYVDPRKKEVTVYQSPSTPRTLREDEMLDGGELLPGLSLSIKDLFEMPQRPS